MNKKSTVRDILIGLVLSGIIALLVFTVVFFKLEPIPIFALLALFVVVSKIKNQWLSFAVVAVVSVAASCFYKEYAIYCLPAAILVWSALQCKGEKVSPVLTAFAQVGFLVSLYFCFTNRNTELTFSNFFATMNKFVLIPIVVIAYIVLQNYSSEDKKGTDDEGEKSKREDAPGIKPIEKSNKALMTSAYVWNAVFLLDMSLRFKTSINVLLIWICAMCYVVTFEEPMLMNAFPALEKILDYFASMSKPHATGSADDSVPVDTPDEVLESADTADKDKEETP